MKKVTGKNFVSQPATLYNFCRYKFKNEIFPGIIPQKDQFVNGRVFFDIDLLTLKKLDDFESDYYSRQSVTVQNSQGLFKACQTYVLESQYTSLLSQQKWDPKEFESEHLSQFLKTFC